MTRKRRRLLILMGGLAGLGAAVALVLTALQDNIVFFFSPTQVVEKSPPPGRRLRVGGLVKEKSFQRLADGVSVSFVVTDYANEFKVLYKGVLPDLFREGQGVVAEGTFRRDGVFLASEVLAKHDENYMPKEVADAIKKSGHWEGSEGK